MKYDGLTTPQNNVWNLQKYYSDTAITNICGVIFFKEERKIELLKQAVNHVISNQAGMRLCFKEVSGEPVQYVTDFKYNNIKVEKFNNRTEFEEYAQNMAKQPLPLYESPMYRFVLFEMENQTGILVVMSHLIADAWSLSLLAKQIDMAYQNIVEGANVLLKGADYLEYVQAEKQYFQSKRFEADRKFWMERYEGKPEETLIKMHNVQTASIEAKRIVKALPNVLTEKIQKYCKVTGATPAVIFEAAMLIYLSKINENNSVTIGIPVLNRSTVREKNTIGMFISTMPLTIEIKAEDSMEDVIRKITLGHNDLFRHKKYPYSSILKNIREKQQFNGNLYDVMMSFQNAITNVESETQWFSNGYSEIPLAFHVDNRDGNSSYTLTVDYQKEVFSQEAEVLYLINRIEYILEQIMTERVLQVEDVQIIPWKEEKLLLEEFNDTQMDYPRDKCVHELFTEQAKRTPDKVALIFEDKKFTYRELDEITNGLAISMKRKGIMQGNKVAVLLKRDEKIIFIQLATLKLGAIFVPIDSRYPRERIDYIVSESKTKLIIKNQDNEMDFENTYDIETLEMPMVNKFEAKKVDSDDVCYIIFTSGSTGKPKGCTLTNKGIVNFCKNNNILEACNRLERQICVSVNTISFDYFIAESILPLLNGYTVVIANDEESTNQEKIKKLVIDNQVNIIQTTPTRYKLYFNTEKDISFIQQFDVMVTSGEALTQDLLKIFRRNKKVKIFNPLGPSECSVWATGGELYLNEDNISAEDITIGKPIANTQIYILDKNHKPLPIGVAGELCISGDGVGKGYLNRPELTAEKFIPNPFIEGKIMYCTGDLARWRADGEIEYLGRMDTQVKIRGLRMELGEIENVLSSFEGIQMTAVTDKRDENGRQYLVGYYTSECEIEEKLLRKHLASKLPKYMIPNYFVRLEQLPMTASGKTDRKNLPTPNFSVQTIRYIAPVTEKEKALCRILEELFLYDRVGVEDDFFEMGGDSLRAIEYIAKAHNAGIEIALQNVFDYPTVRQLCDALECGSKSKVQYQESDFEKYQKILERNIIEEPFDSKPKTLGNVLLTGATGFLGAHVLDELMKKECGKIYCLVRSNAEDDRRGKLKKTLEYYFGDKYEKEFGQRIIPIIGDIEKSILADDIPTDVQTVIHMAASVKHYGSYEYFYQVNVQGTQNVADFAKRVGAKLIHISTLSVSGNSLAEDFHAYYSEEEKYFDEKSLFIRQPLDNVYVHSKFEAEKVVYDAMLEGLDAKIIRVGNLTNRVSDFKFQPNFEQNAFLTRMKAVLEFGMFPKYLLPLYVEFSPIDKTAEGIVKIAQYAEKQCVFHLNNNRPLYFEKMLHILNKLNISMKVVEGNVFNEELQKTIKNPEAEYIYKAFQNDMDEQGKLVYDSNIRILNDFTIWFMKKIGFEWNETEEEYIRGYIEYFRKIGYLKV